MPAYRLVSGIEMKTYYLVPYRVETTSRGGRESCGAVGGVAHGGPLSARLCSNHRVISPDFRRKRKVYARRVKSNQVDRCSERGCSSGTFFHTHLVFIGLIRIFATTAKISTRARQERVPLSAFLGLGQHGFGPCAPDCMQAFAGRAVEPLDRYPARRVLGRFVSSACG